MTTDSGDVVRAYWASAEARDWATFDGLLADDVVYEMPQSRERISGRDRYLQFNKEYPGDWHIAVERVVAQGTEAVSWVTSTVGEKTETGLCFFQLDGSGRIARIADFWPEPYEPLPGREHLTERW